MPETLFIGGRLDSVRVVSGSPVEATTSGRFDSGYADCAIACANTETFAADFKTATANVLSDTDVVTGETLWAHAEFYPNVNSSTVRSVVEFQNAAGEPWLALRTTTTNGIYGVYYNSGTGGSPTWTVIGSTFSLSSSARYALDFKLELGSPHSLEFSLDGTLIRSGTFTQASLTALRRAVFGFVSTGGNVSYWSQLAATRDKSTIGGKVWTRRGTADGTNTGWSGAYTDVNEAVGSDASVQSSTSAGQKETHAIADVTISAGTEIYSVFHWMRAKNDGSAPNNIKSVIRSGGTDYATGNLSGIGTSYGPVGARYDADPATAANWTQSSFNGIEAGYESAT